RSMGLERQWPDIARTYADVNQLFGNIVKVTPTSKVVGDLALYMVAQGLTAEQISDPDTAIDFPASVKAFFRGELGTPMGGFPESLQRKVLGAEQPIVGRPAASLPQADLDASKQQLEQDLGISISATDLASHLMYPKVFAEFAEHRSRYGDVSRLPTPVFFYGLQAQQEINVDIDTGKTLVISLQGQADDAGDTRLFYELNGQPRMIRIDNAANESVAARPRADDGNANHVGAPIPGMVVQVAVQEGQRVEKNEALLSLEAMKMETGVAAPHAGTVTRVHVKTGETVAAHDLLIELEA